MNRQCTASGFTLIEVLIALLVLTLGALGANAAILHARRAGQQSSMMSAAVQLGARVGESMRANGPAAFAAYLQLDYDALADGPPPDAGDCSATACDSAALTAANLSLLRRQTHERFPLGRIKICRDSASFDAAADSLRWQCDGAAAAPIVVKIGWRQRLAQAGQPSGGAQVMVALPLILRANGAP